MKFKNFKIGTKINLMVIGIVLALSVVIVFTVQAQIKEGIKATALDKAESDLKLAYQFIDSKYPGPWNEQNGELYKGKIKISNNFELVDEIGKLTEDTVTIFLGDTRVSTNVIKEGKRAVGTKVSDQVADVVLKQGKTFVGEANVVGKLYQAAYEPIKDANGRTIGIWYVGASQGMIDKTISAFLTQFLTVLAIGIAAIIALMLWFTHRMKKRLAKVTEALYQAGSGNFTLSIEDDSTDEIGLLASSYNQMRASLKDLVHQVLLTSDQVAAASEELSASADQTTKATDHIAVVIQDVATGTENQLQNINQSAHIIQEMTAGIQQISATAQTVSSMAINAAEFSTGGSQAIDTVIDQMDSIHQSVDGLAEVIRDLSVHSKEIGGILEVIKNISKQTNLLALNAAIEAARAGEQGVGFAVVANEVRKLAEQSAQSAQQITGLITNMQKDTERAANTMKSVSEEVGEGMKVVNLAGSSFEQIKQSVNQVSAQILEVSAASKQMSAGTEQVIHSINLVTDIAEKTSSGTQNVSAGVEEQLASMEEISASAATLTQMADEMQTQVGKFKF